MPIKVIDTIKPNGVPLGTSQFPTVEDIDILGGYQVVGTDTVRNAIPTANRKQGMLVYVVADQLFYQLASDLVTWNIANFAGDVTLAGDVTGQGNANTVTKIRGTTVSTGSVANDGYALVSVGGQYVPTGIVPTANVKNFGAKGDGTTDDHVAINNAIASLPNGGIVYFPAGTYVTTQTIVVNKSSIILQGAGSGSGNTSVPAVSIVTKIAFNGSGDAIFFDGGATGVSNALNGCGLADMLIVGNANCTNCLRLRDCHHGSFVRYVTVNCSNAGTKTEFAISNVFSQPRCSTNENTFTTTHC